MATSPTKPAPPVAAGEGATDAVSTEASRRAAARTTAITVGVIALAIYVAFIASGVIGR